MEDKKFVINVGRQLGSGGREIGEKLAHRFNARFYDKEIIEEAAERTGFRKEFFEQSDEKKGFFSRLFNFRNASFGQSDPYAPAISEESMFKIMSDIIIEAAEHESCVFVGRCADYVLREHPNCLNIFISADEPDRIARISRLRGVDEAKAKKIINSADDGRASFYNYYSCNKWGAAATYHLCINSSVLGIDGTVDYIAEYVEKMFG